MKKFSIIALTFVIAITGVLMIGCGKKEEEYALDRVNVYIKSEFQQKFNTKGFTKEEFVLENLERFWYGPWYDNNSDQYGMITVHLIKHGKKQVANAIKHFKALDFVRNAEKQDYNFKNDEILIVLTKEATLSGKEYTVEDFPEINCISVNFVNKLTWELVHRYVLGEDVGNGHINNTYVDSFRCIYSLKLGVKDKKNVLDVIEVLYARTYIQSAETSGYGKVA